jgi:hypothetical protein
MSTAAKPSLRQLSRVNRRADSHVATEAQTQDAIVEMLHDRLGWTVKEIGRWRQAVECPKCHTRFVPHNGMPNTPGAPDLYVTHPRIITRFQAPIWLAIECKAPGGRSLFGAIQPGRVRPEQQELVNAGMVALAHSVPEALAVVGEEGRVR